jgi:hypothetical protein
MYQNDSRHKSCKVSQTKNVQMAIILYGCSWSSYKQTSLNLQYLSFHFLWAHFSLLHSLSLNQTEKAFHLLHINCSNQALVQHNPAPPYLTTVAHTAMTKLDVLLKDKINAYITDGS